MGEKLLKCPICKKEKPSVYFTWYIVRISNEDSYRREHFYICYDCSDKSEMYTTKLFIDSLKIIMEIMENHE